jgi:hypothetical protein
LFSKVPSSFVLDLTGGVVAKRINKYI